MKKSYTVLRQLPGHIMPGTIVTFDPQSGMYECKIFGKTRRILPAKVENNPDSFALVDDKTISI